jgi:hypothetical protein
MNALDETSMNTPALVEAMVDFLESLDIQLALEGNKFCLLEVLRHYFHLPASSEF